MGAPMGRGPAFPSRKLPSWRLAPTPSAKGSAGGAEAPSPGREGEPVAACSEEAACSEDELRARTPAPDPPETSFRWKIALGPLRTRGARGKSSSERSQHDSPPETPVPNPPKASTNAPRARRSAPEDSLPQRNGLSGRRDELSQRATTVRAWCACRSATCNDPLE